MKDIRLTFRAQNDRLLSAIEDRFGTQAEMSRQTGILPQRISQLVSLRLPPVTKSGWSRDAENIASALGVYPSDLWPEHMQYVRIKQATASMSLDVEDVMALTSDAPDICVLEDLISKASTDLSKREGEFLEWLLSGNADATLDEKGNFLGVSRERARQIETRAFRKMRRRLDLLGVKSLEATT